jgi:predicted O-methyltransferase YrrM
MMPELLSPRLLQYLDELLPPRDPLLVELEAQARRERIPICGPHVGGFLALLVRLARPSRVLEVGAAIGYSAVWMGRALREYGGQLQTIELRDARIAQAQANLARAELNDMVEVLRGAALEVLPALRGTTFGLIFLDAVKAEYPAYFEHTLPLLAEGGLLIADNALLGGEVAPGAAAGYWSAADREGVRRYNVLASSHPALESVILPLRDGLTVSLKR